MRQLIRNIAFILFLSFGNVLHAQQDSLLFPQLDILTTKNVIQHSDSLNQIKVTSASRTLKNLDDLPITIYVVTHEEIIRNQFSETLY